MKERVYRTSGGRLHTSYLAAVWDEACVLDISEDKAERNIDIVYVDYPCEDYPCEEEEDYSYEDWIKSEEKRKARMEEESNE